MTFYFPSFELADAPVAEDIEINRNGVEPLSAGAAPARARVYHTRGD